MVAYNQKGTVVAVASLTVNFQVLTVGQDPFAGLYPALSIPGYQSTTTGYASCALCPDIVLSTLRIRALEGYRAIRSIKQFTTFFREVGVSLTQSIINAVAALVGAIPTPFGLSVADLLKFFACPLTPLAVGLDPTILQNMDSRVALRRVQQQIGPWMLEVKEQFLRSLKALEAWPIIRVFVQYIEAIARFRLTPTVLVEATLVSTTVQVVCPDAYRNSPFERFLNEASTFGLVGIVPTSLEGLQGQLARQIGNAYSKFAGWSALSTGTALV